jgi:hypothetical protein
MTRRFGGRRDIIGKSITLDHMTGYIIQGVTAVGFDFLRGIEIYRSIGGMAVHSAIILYRGILYSLWLTLDEIRINS